MNVGRIRATGANRIRSIETRNFLVLYSFMGEIETKRLENLFFREIDRAFVELVSEDENGVRVAAIIFLDDARNVRVDAVVRVLAGQVEYDDNCRDSGIIALSEALIIWRTGGVPKAALYVVVVGVAITRMNCVSNGAAHFHGA